MHCQVSDRLWSLTTIVIFLHHVELAPQQTTPGLDVLISNVFNNNPSTTPQPQRSGGIGKIVTPIPDAQQIQYNSTSGKTCNCVAYHMCDPNTGTTTMPVEDGSFDGFGLIDLRFDSNDPICEHFLDVCCKDANTHRDSLTPKPQEERPNRPQGCGIRNVGGIDFKITGDLDNEAGFGEFPWTVALLHATNHSYFCSGALIHSRVVLTAMHCVRNRAPYSFLVRAGEWDSQTTKERLPFEERTIDRLITHPNFNERNVANNFALLLLSQPVTIGDHINVICLPRQNEIPPGGTQCLANGWGKDVFGEAGRFSAIMKRIPLPIVDFNTCQSQLRKTRLGPKFALDRTFICAGGQRGRDTCQGDGGAPLVCPTGSTAQNRYYQSGIVSWGIGCNDDIPAAYANVALVRDWIDQQMFALGYGTTSYTAS